MHCRVQVLRRAYDMRDTMRKLRSRLVPLYGSGEAQAIIRIIFRYLKGWSAVEMFMNEDKELSADVRASVDRILARLERREPIQYITGIAQFYGMELHVDRRVLIPRPETEQMVDMIADRFRGREDMDVLDIATGSGCIAIALQRNLPFSHVSAMDVDEDALAVARENAARLKSRVNFFLADVFSYNPAPDSFDLMVSNPPYIAESERAGMDANVLNYEPEKALFVPDEDPLLFYSRIAEVAMTGLRRGGMLYLEINSRYGDAIRRLLEAHGLAEVKIINDIHGAQRFAVAKRPDDD